MNQKFVSGVLSGIFLLSATNVSFADNKQWLASKGMKRAETYQQLLNRIYTEETDAARSKATKNGGSFVAPSYQDWEEKPVGTFEGYPESY